MKNLFLTTIIIILSLFQSVAADKLAQYWDIANNAYRLKDYDTAASYFEKIASQKPKNAEVYYNLGNTYYRMNKIGPAVLNYEKALHIDPDYTQAKDNLVLTQNRMSAHVPIATDIFFVQWWETLTAPRMATLWAILAFIFFSAMILLIFLRGISKIEIKIPAQLPVLLGLIWVCLLVFGYQAARNTAESGAAVVMQNDAPLLNTDLKGKPMSLLPEGTTVKVRGSKGEYAEVIVPDGRRGYVLQSWLTKI